MEYLVIYDPDGHTGAIWETYKTESQVLEVLNLYVSNPGFWCEVWHGKKVELQRVQVCEKLIFK